MIIYKIRRKDSPEKFLAGTPTYHSWQKDGRMFQTLGKLRTFVTNTLKVKKDMSTWEIVEFELTVSSVKAVHEIVKPEKIIELLRN